VSHDARIGEIGLVPGIDMEICPAHAHAPDTYKNLTGAAVGHGAFGEAKVKRLVAGHGEHFAFISLYGIYFYIG
jgi:hypothetical protein